jgi:hypothetical protein
VRSMWTVARGIAVVVGALSLAAPRAVAQARRDSRLAPHLESATRVAINALLDSAHAERLPTEPLVDKALEGAKKSADGPRIVSAVRGLLGELRAARAALGDGMTTDEITAAATALHAGLSTADLTRLGTAARRSHRRHITVPLALATDLIARAVPVPTAADVAVSLTQSGARDSELMIFQRNVRLDIERGADPTAAAQTRARGVLLRAKQVQPAGRAS